MYWLSPVMSWIVLVIFITSPWICASQNQPQDAGKNDNSEDGTAQPQDKNNTSEDGDAQSQVPKVSTVTGLLDCQKSNFSVITGIIPPYTFPTDQLIPEGPVHDIVDYAKTMCCGEHVPIIISRTVPAERDVEEKMLAEDLAYPVVKTGSLGIAASTVDGYVFVPIIETPGAVILVQDDDRGDNVVIQSLSQCWPLALVVLSSAGLAGVIVWLLDHSRNPDDFSEAFLKGGWEGIWWAFVTMTTVGYGDKAPKSIFGRIFGLLWMFVGIILMSIFTATLTTALTADQNSDFEVKGSKILLEGAGFNHYGLSSLIALVYSPIVLSCGKLQIGIVTGSKEEIVAFKEGADISAFKTIKDMFDGLLEGTIEGALVDTNYALSKGTDLDEQGIVVTSTLQHPAILGIILQGQTAEVITCLTKHISKSQFKAYDSLAGRMQKFRRDETPSATKATQRVLESMKVVFGVLFCLWFLATTGCLAWEFLYRRIALNRKSTSKRKVDAGNSTTKERPVTTQTIVHS